MSKRSEDDYVSPRRASSMGGRLNNNGEMDYSPGASVEMNSQDQINQLLAQNGMPPMSVEQYYTYLFGPGKVSGSLNPAQDNNQYFIPNSGDTTNTIHPVPSWNSPDPAFGKVVNAGLMAALGYGAYGALGGAGSLGEAAAPSGIASMDAAESAGTLGLNAAGTGVAPYTAGGATYSAGSMGPNGWQDFTNPALDNAGGALTQAGAPVSDAVVSGLGPSATAADIAAYDAIYGTGAGAASVAAAGGGAAGTGLSAALSRVLSGTATSADLLKLGLTAAGAAALALDNPDRTQTNEIKYPDWYNAGAKSALAQADKFAALGPDSVAPLSANENSGIQMAKDSAGNWQPLLDRSGALANEAAGGIPSIDLSAYMNPYLDNVLKPIQRRNEIAKAGALQDINAKAGMRGAFGGSRNDLLTNLASESADRNMNEAEANIRSSAFTTGLNTAQNDLTRKLNASGQFRSNAGALGDLTDADIARLMSTGGISRTVEQNRLNAPLTAIGGYAAALRGAGNPGSTSTTTLPESSKLGQAVGGLTALAGASKYGLI